MYCDIETQRRPNNAGWLQCMEKLRLKNGEPMEKPAFHDFYISLDMRIFDYLSNWIYLLRLTLGIWCFTLAAQMDFATKAMFCKVFWFLWGR